MTSLSETFINKNTNPALLVNNQVNQASLLSVRSSWNFVTSRLQAAKAFPFL